MRWLEERQRYHGGKCTQAEWETFLIMDKRMRTWNRKQITIYCKYLEMLPAGGNIMLTRSTLAALGIIGGD